MIIRRVNFPPVNVVLTAVDIIGIQPLVFAQTAVHPVLFRRPLLMRDLAAQFGERLNPMDKVNPLLIIPADRAFPLAPPLNQSSPAVYA